MDNFDLKKYLIETKVTTNSRMLKEDATSGPDSFIYAISDDVANDLRMDIEKLQKEADIEYGFSKYKEGTDYEWAIGRGDDFPNALVVLNPKMIQDPKVTEFIAWVEKDEDSL